jgi:hypothetical protein
VLVKPSAPTAEHSVQPRVDEEVRQAMRNDGIALFSSAEEDQKMREEGKDFVEEMTQGRMQELCAERDASALGTSPSEEWNCPGY